MIQRGDSDSETKGIERALRSATKLLDATRLAVRDHKASEVLLPSGRCAAPPLGEFCLKPAVLTSSIATTPNAKSGWRRAREPELQSSG